MALKDKPVDLEDLKALKDWIVGRIDMYEDITSTLTWSNATWVPTYNKTKDTTSGKITGVKVAKISVTKGDKYRAYCWFNADPGNDDPRTIPFGKKVHAPLSWQRVWQCWKIPQIRNSR